jgi:L-asparagine transporter-like permease
MTRGIVKREEINNEKQNKKKFKLPWYHIITHIVIIIGLIVLAIVFPQVSIVLFIGIPILFSLSNIFLDNNRRFRRNIIEKNNGVRGHGV